MISVLCVRFGNKYGPEYVERLRNMVARHLTVPYEFICLTDDQHPIEGVRSIILADQGYTKKWWHKVHMFDPGLGLNGRILYLGLDVVIVNNIDKLVKDYTKNEFLGIRDFNRKFNPAWKILNSSVMSWVAGQHPDIYTIFKGNMNKAQQLHGDQDWIFQVAKGRIIFWPDQYIMSYKWEIRDRTEISFGTMPRKFKTIKNPTIPADCSILVFHGDPNPHDVEDPIIVDNWQ